MFTNEEDLTIGAELKSRLTTFETKFYNEHVALNQTLVHCFFLVLADQLLNPLGRVR